MSGDPYKRTEHTVGIRATHSYDYMNRHYVPEVSVYYECDLKDLLGSYTQWKNTTNKEINKISLSNPHHRIHSAPRLISYGLSVYSPVCYHMALWTLLPEW